jgi:hypothetical protein
LVWFWFGLVRKNIDLGRALEGRWKEVGRTPGPSNLLLTTFQGPSKYRGFQS